MSLTLNRVEITNPDWLSTLTLLRSYVLSKNFDKIHPFLENIPLGVLDGLKTEREYSDEIWINGKGIIHAAINFKKTRDVNFLRFLFAHRANPNYKSSGNEYTALHESCYNDYLDVTKFLIQECKVDINAQDALGQTPLHKAMIRGCFETVKFLSIQKDLDISIREYYGSQFTPLECGINERDKTQSVYFGQLIKCIDLLQSRPQQ